MQKLTSLFLLLTLCSAPFTAAFNGRSLLQGGASASSGSSASSTGGGSASASATAVSTGGTARAVAEATSEAFVAVENSVVEFFDAVFNQFEFPDPSSETFCADALSVIDEELVAVGRVVAEAYASAIADVEVIGEGQACADANAAARAQAEGFVAIIVDAIVRATNTVTEADAQLAVDQRLDVFASAFATAFASACAGDDSRATATQTSFARAVIEPVASLAIFLIAGVDCGGGSFGEALVDAENTVTGETVAETTSTTDTEGDAAAEAGGTAGAQTAVGCSGRYSICCFRNFIGRDTCGCTSGSRPRCNAVNQGGSPVIWFDEDAGVNCFCR